MGDEAVLERMVSALATKDRAALESAFDAQATMRALLPSRLAEAWGPAAIAAEMLDWFDDAPRISPIAVRFGAVGDRYQAVYRFALGGMDVPRVVEQNAYCTVSGGLVDRLWLVCSGFRPIAEAPVASVAALPGELVAVADGRIDALGDGCATLTPRIAAAMRELAAGQVLAVLTDDPSAPADIAAWSRLTGHEVIAATPESGGTRFYLKHKP